MAFIRQWRCASALPAAGVLPALLALSLCVAPVFGAARTPDKTGLRRQAPSARGATVPGSSRWAFGKDEGQTLRWRQGISGAELQHKAVVGREKAPAGSGAAAKSGNRLAAAPLPGHGGKSAAADVDSGGDKSGVYLSWERDITTWQPETPAGARRAGEVFSLHQRHIVRAQARAVNKNASVSVGPEVILKDDNDKAVAKDPHSPDSAVGFGMHFMVGF